MTTRAGQHVKIDQGLIPAPRELPHTEPLLSRLVEVTGAASGFKRQRCQFLILLARALKQFLNGCIANWQLCRCLALYVCRTSH
jgi:hypothetical protein